MNTINYLVLALTIISLSSKAATITVCNNANSPGQYSNLQNACNSASAGDTILVHATGISYGNISINKKLTLIGEGAYPNQQMTYSTILDNVSISKTAAGDNPDGTHITGFLITAGIQFKTSSGSINNIQVSRNFIKGAGGGTGGNYSFNLYDWGTAGNVNNLLITQNVISGDFDVHTTYYKFTNSLIINNIIIGNFGCYNTANSNAGNNQILNNIIGSYSFWVQGDYIANNIFYNPTSNFIPNIYNNSNFLNNIFYHSASATYNNINGNNNIFSQDPLFNTAINLSDLNNYSLTTPANGPFADFHLQLNSIGHNYGSDGTDVGIYGGSTPWIDGTGFTTNARLRYFTMPNVVPFVMSLDILNLSVLPNGTLNVNFNARTQE